MCCLLTSLILFVCVCVCFRQILTLEERVDTSGETQEERQGKMLLHTEYSLLSLLHNQDGVVHHHSLFQVYPVSTEKRLGRTLCSSLSAAFSISLAAASDLVSCSLQFYSSYGCLNEQGRVPFNGSTYPRPVHNVPASPVFLPVGPLL